MIKRIVEISSARTHLSVRYGQLVVRQEGREEAQIPCEDIGVLLVDHPGVTYTHSVFTELVKNGGAVVLCGGNHHPAGMVLAIEGNTVQTEKFRAQAEAKEPVQHEAKVLGRDCRAYAGLMALAGRVRSGDPSNIEAQASRRYWRYFLEDGRFRRDVNAGGVNSLLNYGYMAMRAAVARALVSAGLMVTLGIHHRNRYNAFCLADDVMEPFRGFVEGLFAGGRSSRRNLTRTSRPSFWRYFTRRWK